MSIIHLNPIKNKITTLFGGKIDLSVAAVTADATHLTLR
jgi:hypothetical protein